jgi:lipopolysaccharide export system protein LptA
LENEGFDNEDFNNEDFNNEGFNKMKNSIMNKRLRKIRFSLGILLLFVSGAMAAMPDEAQLSADRMRFDSQSGDYLAVGNVLIRAGGLAVHAQRGTGNVRNKEIRFSEGIVASGDWQGQRIDLAAGSISLFFAQTPTYIAENGVKGKIGKISIDVDKFYMKGADFSALAVRRLEDHEADISFAAENLQGTLVEGVLTTSTAKGNVRLTGRPNPAGEMMDIHGDTAVYSVERGSVVLSGNVRAVQKSRVLTAQSLVYFPNDNRIEAMGGYPPEGTKGGAAPVRITIDLNEEKSNKE